MNMFSLKQWRNGKTYMYTFLVLYSTFLYYFAKFKERNKKLYFKIWLNHV